MVKRVVKERMPISRTGIYNRLKAKGLRFKVILPSLSSSALSLKIGFTLLELIVVIFIISLFLAISIPSFKGIGSNEIRSEAKRIASILRYLNDAATARKEKFYLTVNFKDHSITYTTEEGEKKEKIEYLRSVFLDSMGEAGSGEVRIAFTPLGAGEFIRFSLAREEGKEGFNIELNPLSGRIRIVSQDT